mmetsp:Transcript_69879/g.194326  ORF Transcript_69879/g.194326 Transcript_69879/m.194326 type:complete len:339 (+) Transcript_69879:1089-2105(+)
MLGRARRRHGHCADRPKLALSQLGALAFEVRFRVAADAVHSWGYFRRGSDHLWPFRTCVRCPCGRARCAAQPPALRHAQRHLLRNRPRGVQKEGMAGTLSGLPAQASLAARVLPAAFRGPVGGRCLFRRPVAVEEIAGPADLNVHARVAVFGGARCRAVWRLVDVATGLRGHCVDTHAVSTGAQRRREAHPLRAAPRHAGMHGMPDRLEGRRANWRAVGVVGHVDRRAALPRGLLLHGASSILPLAACAAHLVWPVRGQGHLRATERRCVGQANGPTSMVPGVRARPRDLGLRPCSFRFLDVPPRRLGLSFAPGRPGRAVRCQVGNHLLTICRYAHEP